MNNIKIRSKRNSFKKKDQIEVTKNTYIRPFKEMPSVNISRQESAGRINPHDLFSHYTVDIIKEDIVYGR